MSSNLLDLYNWVLPSPSTNNSVNFADVTCGCDNLTNILKTKREKGEEESKRVSGLTDVKPDPAGPHRPVCTFVD